MFNEWLIEWKTAEHQCQSPAHSAHCTVITYLHLSSRWGNECLKLVLAPKSSKVSWNSNYSIMFIEYRIILSIILYITEFQSHERLNDSKSKSKWMGM